MIIFPAIDIQGGQAVRLRQGRKEDVTVFAANPMDAARRWQEEGAEYLHVVDLDGAFEGRRANAALIGSIAEATGLPVQVGGGIRTLEAAAQYLGAGVTRIIIGTTALEQPELFATMCAHFPGRVGVSLDAVEGRLKTRGWVGESSLTVATVMPQLQDAGAAFVIYTDIARDGMQTGVNLGAVGQLLTMTSLPVIVAGGVHTVADVRAVGALRGRGQLEGIISGRALYEGSLSLAEAMAAARESD